MPRWPKMSPLTAEQSKLVADNYPLVLFAVRRLWRIDPEASLLEGDAIGEGYLALIKAVRKFNPERGVKFNTYAMRAIYSNVRQAARRWRRKTFVPDMNLLCRQYRGRVGVNRVEKDSKAESC